MSHETKVREMIEELKEKYNISDKDVRLKKNIYETKGTDYAAKSALFEMEKVIGEHAKRSSYQMTEELYQKENHDFRPYLRDENMYLELKPQDIMMDIDDDDDEDFDDIDDDDDNNDDDDVGDVDDDENYDNVVDDSPSSRETDAIMETTETGIPRLGTNVLFKAPGSKVAFWIYLLIFRYFM